MAKRNSTSKIARARKSDSHRAKTPPGSSRPSNQADCNSAERSPFEDFGRERVTLLKAEAVLACLNVSLNYYGWSADDGTVYAVAADVARDLLQQAMDQLEQRDREIESAKKPRN